MTKFTLTGYSATIVDLIIDDLKITKLLNGISMTGLDTTIYQTNIYKVLLLLLGIQSRYQTEELKDWYFKQTERIYDIELSDTKEVYEIAGQIMVGLATRKFD